MFFETHFFNFLSKMAFLKRGVLGSWKNEENQKKRWLISKKQETQKTVIWTKNEPKNPQKNLFIYSARMAPKKVDKLITRKVAKRIILWRPKGGQTNNSPAYIYICQRSRDHIMASRGSRQKGVQCQRALHSLRTQIIISSTLHHLQKFDFRHHLILPVFISLPLRDFGFSSPVIVIVKIHFDIWHGSRAGWFRAWLICYVSSRPVKSRRLNDDATDESNHIIIRRRGEKSMEIQTSRGVGHQNVQQWPLSTTRDFHHPHHSMVSSHHMSSGQKRYSPSCQSQTIRSLFQSFKRSQVTKTSSQRRSSSKESYQRSLKRSRTRIQRSRRSHQEFGS